MRAQVVLSVGAAGAEQVMTLVDLWTMDGLQVALGSGMVQCRRLCLHQYISIVVYLKAPKEGIPLTSRGFLLERLDSETKKKHYWSKANKKQISKQLE